MKPTSHRAVVLASGGLIPPSRAIAKAGGLRALLLTMAYGQRHAVEVERVGSRSRLGRGNHLC